MDKNRAGTAGIEQGYLGRKHGQPGTSGILGKIPRNCIYTCKSICAIQIGWMSVLLSTTVKFFMLSLYGKGYQFQFIPVHYPVPKMQKWSQGITALNVPTFFFCKGFTLNVLEYFFSLNDRMHQGKTKQWELQQGKHRNVKSNLLKEIVMEIGRLSL